MRLAKIVGVVKWLHDNNIPVDLGWLSAYPIQKVDTPTTTPGVVARKARPTAPTPLHDGRGDLRNAQHVQADVNGQASALGANAWLRARPRCLSPGRSSTTAKTIKAVALNLAPTKTVGGYADTWTDASVPLAGGKGGDDHS